ncbi:MAG: hypothetical protein ACI9W6_001839 [Motiliproteus sp.]|jgi:hypothetical protein
MDKLTSLAGECVEQLMAMQLMAMQLRRICYSGAALTVLLFKRFAGGDMILGQDPWLLNLGVSL